MKNRSHRYDINMMLLICIKQHLSNIWSSIHEKFKQHWGWVEKKRCLQKKRLKRAAYIILSLHLQSYKITELQPLFIFD